MTEPANPADAIVAHHAEMLCELQARTDVLAAAVGIGEPSAAPLTALRDYIDSTIVPHALAEERTIYPAARQRERRLVDSLLLEHDALRRLAGDLAAAGGDLERVAASSAFVELFGLHAAKENEFAIPAILEDPASDLGELLAAMHTTLEAGEASVTEAATELDVRGEPPARRHQLIFDAFHALRSGDGFVLVNDHDPKPLYYQFAAEYPGCFEWDPLEEGPDVWRVYIGSRAPVAATAVSIPMIELQSIATMVIEGLRARGCDAVVVTKADAAAAWERLQATLRSGVIGHAESADLAHLLSGVGQAADAAGILR